jgi:hypothetical protein
VPCILLTPLTPAPQVGYEEYAKKSDGGASRWARVGELASMAAPYRVGELGLFLDQVRPKRNGRPPTSPFTHTRTHARSHTLIS